MNANATHAFHVRSFCSLSPINKDITIMSTVLQQWDAQCISLRKMQKQKTLEIKLLRTFELNTDKKHGNDTS